MELARRCLQGDVNALREFVELYRRPVYSLCLRMLQHHQDAEDTAQESLLRALRYLKSWDSTQPLTPWVMKIAANRCRTHLEKRRRVISTTDGVAQQMAPPTTGSLGLGEELQLALEVLSEQQRRCFCLFYLEELSIAEIALQMEVPQGTVKTWLHRSRKQLAERLRERGVVPTVSIPESKPSMRKSED